MVFEKADASRIGQLVDLRLAYLAEDGGALTPEDAARIRRDLPGYFRNHLNRGLIGFVAREGETLAACALLLIVEKPMSPAFINGRTGTVLNVYTRPEYRRRGYARRLMEMLMAEAKARELCVVELKATEMGAALYRSMGFADDASAYRRMAWRCGDESPAPKEKRYDI